VGNSNIAATYSNGGNRWNILGFNFTKIDALSSVYKISMGAMHNIETFLVFTSFIQKLEYFMSIKLSVPSFT
jgi:hypothetical protein